ncbi:MAG TPA: GspE/PulE family protein [Candidatus Dormibacteraeota bacterium]
MVDLKRNRIDENRADGRRIGELLIERGALRTEILNDALRRQKRDRRPLGELLVERGVDEPALVAALGLQWGRPTVDLDTELPSDEALLCLDGVVARRLRVLPVSLDGDGRLRVATLTPDDPALSEALRTASGLVIELLLTDRTGLQNGIDRHYGVIDRIDSAAARAVGDRVEMAPSAATATELDAPVVQLVDLILAQGVRDRASDIHIEPQQHRLRVRFRVDGSLLDVRDLPRELAGSVASRIKVMAAMDIVDRHRAQDGQIATLIDGREIDIRVATMETIWGEKIVMRLLDKTRSLVSLPSLGLKPEVEGGLRRLVASPYGLIVVSGPTGAGKTTTLYSLLNELDRGVLNITTIEDPVEYHFDDVNQIRINRLAGVTFANGLRAILRQDPDVILIGEVRDSETAGIAIQAALTGHLVLCSLHASDTAGAIHRFIDMGIESFLVASALIGVVAQRLVRTVCERCAEEQVPGPEEVEFYRSVTGKLPRFTPMAGRGCPRCANSGFYGRTGVFECLQIDEDYRQLIVDRSSQTALRRAAVERGMTTLRHAGCDIAEQGRSTLAEAMRAVYMI